MHDCYNSCAKLLINLPIIFYNHDVEPNILYPTHVHIRYNMQAAAGFVEIVLGRNATSVLSHFLGTIMRRTLAIMWCTSVKGAPSLHMEQLLNVMGIECRM